MEIIIGREEGARRLHCIADGREFNLGVAGSVPSSVSRKHCKIHVSGNNIRVENMRDMNITYVDGTQVFNKQITENCKLQLGTEKYNVPLKQILSLVGYKNQSPHPQELQNKTHSTFSLAPLEEIWNEYEKRKFEIQQHNIDQQNKQRMMMGARMTLGSIPIVGQIAGAIMGAKMVHDASNSNDAVPLFIKLRNLDEEFALKYACPNPECGRPFGSQPYRQVKFIKKCPSCGCQYTIE